MKAGINYIRKELAQLYDRGEIESFISLIFSKLMGYSRVRLLLADDEMLAESKRAELVEIVSRLKKHEPIQYILGTTEFYGLSFFCKPEVLIPRPETEELVQWIISDNKLLVTRVLDIGTGSGCIAVSLRKFLPQSTVSACDISSSCIALARENAELNDADIQLFTYDILGEASFPGTQKFDIVVSNPPYVRESEKRLMCENVLDYEPDLALFVPDDDPLLYYKRIADFAMKHLENRGRLYFEINEALGYDCCYLLESKGFSRVEMRKDIHGKNRMVACSWETER